MEVIRRMSVERKMRFVGAAFLAAALPVMAEQPSAKQKVLFQKLEAEIHEVDAQLDGVLGVAVEDLKTGQTILLNPDEVFPQASSIKIAVLAELYHQNEQAMAGARGKAKLSDLYTMRAEDLVAGSDIFVGLTPGVTVLTNRDLATMMVAVSDDSATNVLIERLGFENVNAFLESSGLHATRLRRKMMDLDAAKEGRENVSTPREMMMLLAKIYEGRLFSKESTADFLKVLSTHKGSAMLRGLPDDVVAANKPGELEAVRTDSGIVFAKDRPFVLCVMTTYLKNERAGEDVISRIAAAAWTTFDRLGRASDYGRVISLK
jgi:beta-lactamase class A